MKLLRIVSIVIAAIVMVGFGLCGLLGVATGVEVAPTGGWLNVFLFMGLGCLAVCGVLAWFLAKKFRRAQQPPGQ